MGFTLDSACSVWALSVSVFAGGGWVSGSVGFGPLGWTIHWGSLGVDLTVGSNYQHPFFIWYVWVVCTAFQGGWALYGCGYHQNCLV